MLLQAPYSGAKVLPFDGIIAITKVIQDRSSACINETHIFFSKLEVTHLKSLCRSFDGNCISLNEFSETRWHSKRKCSCCIEAYLLVPRSWMSC